MVTAGHREAADIGIADGRIARLGGTMTGTRELAAGGLLAIPGGVDAHTHLVHQGLGGRVGFPVWVDDFWSGSRAAIAGGITTIGNMTFSMPDEEGTEETPGAAITREMAGAAPEAAVDWFLHPVLVHPAALPEGEVATLAEHGHASIKMFLSDPDLAAGEPTRIARGTGARVYIVHLSSAAALDRCRRARAAGVPVYVETRPLYLHLTRERCGTRRTAARSTARGCNRFPAIRSTTAGRCRAGRGSSSAAASLYSLTARSPPAPATANGSGATQRPGHYPPGPGAATARLHPGPAIPHTPAKRALPHSVATPPALHVPRRSTLSACSLGSTARKAASVSTAPR